MKHDTSGPQGIGDYYCVHASVSVVQPTKWNKVSHLPIWTDVCSVVMTLCQCQCQCFFNIKLMKWPATWFSLEKEKCTQFEGGWMHVSCILQKEVCSSVGPQAAGLTLISLSNPACCNSRVENGPWKKPERRMKNIKKHYRASDRDRDLFILPLSNFI